MLKVFESSHGHVRAQKVPTDASVLIEDNSEELNMVDATLFRFLVGMAIYLSQERVDIAFCVKELASKMARPTAIAFARLKKFLDSLKSTPHYAVKLKVPERGIGKVINCQKELALETFSDSDWAGSKNIAAPLQQLYISGDLVHGSSRTQKVIALSSAGAELHSLVSAAADGIYIAGCLSVLTGLLVKHYILVDNMAAKTLPTKPE